MNDQRLTLPLQRLRAGRRRSPAVWLALLAYLFAGAAVPAGHMAAPLASGTIFHLCPGDLRSAQVIDAIAAATSSPHDSESHHHHGHGEQEDKSSNASPDSPAVAKSSTDPGCAFAAGASADAGVFDVLVPLAEPSASLAEKGWVDLPSQRRWFLPRVRSPPA